MAKKQEAPVQTYPVLAPLHHNGERYNAGDTVDLTWPEAASLIALRIVAAIEPAAAGAEE